MAFLLAAERIPTGNALIPGRDMPAGNNKSIRDWPINSSVGYAIHE
jgi:hypothetical protein